MAVTGASIPTLVDVAAMLDPDGTPAKIAEMLNQTNEVLPEMSWIEGNLPTGHRTVVRNSLPGVGWRRLNQGIAVSKSTNRPVDEGAAMLEGNSQVDRKLAILSGDINRFRMSEAAAFLESMNQAFLTALFYGNAAIFDNQFTGLAPRYNSLSGTTAPMIIDGGGTGTDNRSIWLINWGPETVTGIYPKNTTAGLQHMDTTTNNASAGDGHPTGDILRDASGNPYLGYTDHWEWNCGLAVKDPRHIVRIANIDRSLLIKDKSTGADLQDLMVQALELIQGAGPNLAFYAPRAVRSFLRRQLLNAKNGQLSWGEMAGQRVMQFGEAPIRRVDILATDEARVV